MPRNIPRSMPTTADNFGIKLIKNHHPSLDAFVSFPETALGRSIPSRFEEITKQYPRQVAISSADALLSYATLNSAANGLGKVLLSHAKTNRVNPIALLFEQGGPLIIAMMGILKSGQCCVQLDPTYPRPRLQHYFEHSRAKILVTNTKNLRLAKSLANKTCLIIDLDQIDSSVSVGNLDLPIKSDSPAFILYTSGSTGKPKGVLHSHRSLLFDVKRQTNDLLVYPKDRLGLVFPGSSSGCLQPICGALLTGSTVYPFDLKQKGVIPLVRWLREKKITICDLPVSAFRHLAEGLSGSQNFPKLRVIAPVGEPISNYEVQLFQRRFSMHCVLQNALGSTETRTISQYFLGKSTPFRDTAMPAGYAVDGKEIMILDKRKRLVDCDAVGHIAVRSSYLSSGYWRDTRMTKKAFLLGKQGEPTTYLTGDLGRLKPDGCLICLGRIDSQVKIRGYRVETPEVELALMTLSCVKEAVVVGLDHPRGGKYLVAYVVLSKKPTPRPTYLRRALAQVLPDFMIPTSFVIRQSFPLTPNGKLNRAKLPPPPLARKITSKRYVPPCNQLEQSVSTMIRRALGLDQVGRNDHFFDLGGHSLIASQVIAEIQTKWNVEISMNRFIKSPTAAGLGREIQRLEAKRALHVPRSQQIVLEGTPSDKRGRG